MGTAKPKPIRLTQPEEMKTKAYIYGVDKVNGYDAWALFEAAAAGEIPKAKTLLAKDRRLINAQYWYQFPIHIAVFGGHAPMVELLLKHGADPGQSRYTYNSWNKLLLAAKERGHGRIESLLVRTMQRKFNYTPEFDPLKKAIIARDPRKISLILRRKPGLATASDALGNNPLHWSVITRQLSLIDRFVEAGTPIDACRADGRTPVLIAVNGAADYWYRDTRGRSHPSLRNTDVLVGSLLAHGADYSISVAAAMGDYEQTQRLLSRDAGLARRLDSARSSPLSYAAGRGYLHIVRLLLEHGAAPNTPEDSAPNGAALFNACCENHLEVARLLLEHGADPNAGVDSSGCCLTIAEVRHGAGAKPIQKLLRDHGAYTPPYAMNLKEMRSAIRKNHKVVRHEEFLSTVMRTRNARLLDAYLRSDPTVPKRLWSGAYPKSPRLIRHLLAHGLDANNPDWLGRTFLHFCVAHGDRACAAVFLKAGADLNARDFENKETPLALAIRLSGAEKNPEQLERRRGMVEFFRKCGATLR